MRLPIPSLKVSPSHQLYSSTTANTAALDAWIAYPPPPLTLTATLHASTLADLHATLPTRASTPASPPAPGAPLAPGHHLAFFHPRTPERALRADGTDAEFCPPAPWVRRMWAGGRMVWREGPGEGLVVGEDARLVARVAGVEKKSFGGEGAAGMVFVKQKIEIAKEGREEAAVEEERTHVYLPLIPGVKTERVAKPVTGLPRPDFSFTYTPSPTTLFRFSALTFNGHYIHLDKDYAQKVEGYPERLVHGPLTALLLLEMLLLHRPHARPRAFEYRARAPLVVGRACTVQGAWGARGEARVWAADAEGRVGMTGSVTYS